MVETVSEMNQGPHLFCHHQRLLLLHLCAPLSTCRDSLSFFSLPIIIPAPSSSLSPSLSLTPGSLRRGSRIHHRVLSPVRLELEVRDALGGLAHEEAEGGRN